MPSHLPLWPLGAALPAAGEADLKLPDLDLATFFSGAIGGRALLSFGLLVCVLGLAFGFLAYQQLHKMPVHPSMREISELIYETCKAYLAVSYTHLDVYKRQVLGISSGTCAPHARAQPPARSALPWRRLSDAPGGRRPPRFRVCVSGARAAPGRRARPASRRAALSLIHI